MHVRGDSILCIDCVTRKNVKNYDKTFNCSINGKHLVGKSRKDMINLQHTLDKIVLIYNW